MSTAKYDLDRFDPQPDPELICNICQSVFCEPTETPCRHVFCKNCITTWLINQRSCPTCRKRTTKISLQPVLPIIQNMINKLTVKCEHAEKGCQATVFIELYESHLKECVWEMVKCENGPCLTRMFRKDFKAHQKKCKHRLVECQQDCRLEIPKFHLKTHNCLQELKRKVLVLQETLKKTSDEKSELKKQVIQLEKNLKDAQQNRRRVSFSNQSVDSWGGNWSDDYYSSVSEYTLDQSQTAESPQNLNDNFWSWNVAFPARLPSPPTRSRRASSQRRTNSNDLLSLLPSSNWYEGNAPQLNTSMESPRISTDGETIQAAGTSQPETGRNNMPRISSIITMLQQLITQPSSGIEENQTLQPLLSSTFAQNETEATTVIESIEDTVPEMQEIVPPNGSCANVNLAADKTEFKLLDLDDNRDQNHLTSLDETSEESIQSIRMEPIINQDSNGTEEVEILNYNARTTKENNTVVTKPSNFKSNKLSENRSMFNKLPRKGQKFASNEPDLSIDMKQKKKTSNVSMDLNKSVDWLSKNGVCNPDAGQVNEKGPSFKKIYKLKRKNNQVKMGDISLPGTSGLNYEQNLRSCGKDVAINSKLKNIKNAKFELKLSGVIPSDHSLAKKSRIDTLQISNECISQNNVKPKNNKKLGHKNRNSIVIKSKALVCNGMSTITTDSNAYSSQSEPINGILATSMSNNISKSNEALQSTRSSFELNISEDNKNIFPRREYNGYLANNYTAQTNLVNDSSTLLNCSSSDETWTPHYISDNTSSEATMTESESDYEIRVPKSTSQLLQEYLSNESDESWHPW